DSGTVLTTDTFSTAVSGSSSPEISVSSDTNTEIVSNTLETNCSAGVSVAASTGTTIENNVVASVGDCSLSGTADELVVDKASSTSIAEGYNVLGSESGMTPYEWAGAAYSTQASFASASGQGAQDVVDASFDLGTSASTEDSDAHASANASAPGELSTDMYGNAWPSSTPDRGAIAFEELTSATLYAQDVTPQQIAVTLDLQGVAWGENDTVTIDWGDGSTDSNFNLSPGMQTNFSDIENYHMYAQIGTYTVTVTMQDDAQKIVRTATLATAGSTYVPVTPTRVLDTRHGTGAPTAKVASEGTLPVNVVNGVTLPSGIGTITAVVMNVTVTNPTAGGNISAYPGGTARPTTSNLNFGTGETVPNLVTVRVGAGDVVDLHNDSPGSTDLVADVEGYYVASTAGSYYLAYTPQRILDTRNDTGGVQGPVAANGTVSISVPQCASGSGAAAQTATATAVALNVTVTDPTSNGHITVYPGATDLPNSSNLNFSAKETVPNLVVAKVGSNGKVNLTDVGSGTAQLVVDLEGCYSATLGDAFVPINPVRVLDSRSGLGQDSVQGQAAQPDQTVAWSQEDIAPFPLNASNGASAVVMNVTVTQPKAAGNIIAYPYGATRPTTSNLNFTPGETVPNLVMVPFYAGWQNSLYNNSKGTSELIADYYGYFG
ncbi:MAG TPA: hypothetical protein VFN97_17745, partial [Actinospica sp.]|nr:hypothetical protein [Actinospica sp.]